MANKSKYRVEFQTMNSGLIPKGYAPFQLAAGRRHKKKNTKKLNKLLHQNTKRIGLSVKHKTDKINDVNNKIKEHLELLNHIHKQKGSGFLSGLLKGVSSTLGAIGKPIFESNPALKPYAGLLGDNSAYNLASKALEKVGLGRRKKRVRGKGFFSSIKKGLSSIKDKLSNVKERITTVFTGITKLNPICRKILEQYGNETIQSLQVAREPIQGGVAKALNLISLGTFNKAKEKLGYDSFFHLFLIATMSSGERIRIEKNEVINMTTNLGGHEKRELMPVSLNDKQITLNEFMENTKNKMGDKFLSYNANTNNCQAFVRGCLEANGLYNETLNKFVMQNTEELFSRMPSFVEKIGKLATDLGGKVNVLRHGAGQKKRKLIAGRGFVSDLFGGLASNLLKDGVGMAGNLLKDGLKSGLSKGLDFAKSEMEET